MAIYNHILTAVEMHDDGERVLVRARDLARAFGARLSVIHVIEYLPVDPAGDALLATPVDLSNERAEHARERLREWSGRHGIESADMTVVIGAITAEILRARDRLAADLVVIGHHPRSGLSALFSHTDDGVLQRAACDVLALNLSL